MYNQRPIIGTINTAFADPQDELDQSEMCRMGERVQPSYYPNAGRQIPMAKLNRDSSGHANQPYGAPEDLHGRYAYPGTSLYPQAALKGHTEVTVQPTVVVSSKSTAAPVPDYLWYSIFTMLCCCLPLGSAAIAYSCSARDASLAGHRELAKSSSRSALILNNIALGIGLIILIICITLIVLLRLHIVL